MVTTEYAPAKINLGLRILGKRPDGFHDILSVFQTINVFDTLDISSNDAAGLSCTNDAVPRDDSNLICRAETLFLEHSGIAVRSHFHLEKQLPMGAGLGGGSSDAAATLRGLWRFHDSSMPTGTLITIAKAIGSDVPFLVHGGTAIVSGRGEHIVPVEWPFNFSYVIVFPGFGVSTAWAYGALKNYSNSRCYREMTDDLLSGSIDRTTLIHALVNDFEPVVFRAHPELGYIKDSMRDKGAMTAFMSGSGSSMVGVFDRESDAINCAQAMRRDYVTVYTARAYPPIRIRP